jgi:integrase
MPIHILAEDSAMTLKDGRYDDGGGLWLIVRNSGKAASYFFEYNGKLVGEKGWESVSVGSRKKTSLALARKRADFCRTLIDRNISPRYWREHERKELRKQDTARLTVAEAVAQFFEFGKRRLWRKPSVVYNKGLLIKKYFQPSAIWNMPVQEIEAAHAAALLEPIWFSKRGSAIVVQTFGYSLFRWLKLNKLHFSENPFDGSRHSPLIELLGGPLSRNSGRTPPEVEDIPLIMAYVRKPPGHSDDVCTTSEAVEATGRTRTSIDAARRRGLFPGAYPWVFRSHPTSLIPVKELVKVFPLRQPLHQHAETPLEYLVLQYVLLTLVRGRMAINLRWDQVNDKRGLIIYPREDHKTGGKTNDEYNVIITPAVAEVLDAARAYQEQHGVKSSHVFVKGLSRTGVDRRFGNKLGDSTLWNTFKALTSCIPGIQNPHATLHDVRTTFITWAVDQEDYPKEHADAVLGHAIKGITNKTYFRNVKYLAQMREIMTHWGKFVLKIQPGFTDVIPIRNQPGVRM